MEPTKRIKIRLRPAGPARGARLAVRDKTTCACSSCGNMYYDFHVYCPQCLGEVAPSRPAPSLLRILSVPQEKRVEIAILFAMLTGKKTFPFQKALESLPWIPFRRTQDCVLRQWKQVLDAEHVETEIKPGDSPGTRSWRGRAPAFTSDAPPPRFLSETTTTGVRHVAQSLKDPLLKLKWVETVLAGFRIVEDFYKRHPTHRVLFSDFLFQIDHTLQEVVKDYDSLYKISEGEMRNRIEKTRAEFDAMATEIQDVRKRVEERL